MSDEANSSVDRRKSSEPSVIEEVEGLLAVEPRVGFDDEPRTARITNSGVYIIRGLIGFGVVAVAAFFWFALTMAEQGVSWLYWPLIAFFAFGAVLSLYEWFCYLGVTPERDPPRPSREWSVDVLTTWCPGEPKKMVVATLKSILRMPYPHTTYLCDEGDDPALREICRRLGVVHVTREVKVGAKAGNINNALRRATGEIVVIMDPDHETAPYFLDRVVGYFEDPAVGFVQHVQAYYNQDESLIARGAAEQTYHFYGPIQTGMHGHGSTQAIGANCTFRRAALDSISGHATGLAEDMATTLKLYAAGWTSVYTPQILSRGQVPATFAGYCKQQLKWACGVWDILIESYGPAFATISWRNRLHYIMNGLFYLRGPIVLLGVLVPIVALFTGLVPIKITIAEFLLWFGPMLASQVLIRQAAQNWLLEKNEYGLHLAGGFLMNAVWLIHLHGLISALLRVKIPYIPTPKDDSAANAWSLAMPNLVLAALSLAAMFFGLLWDWSPFSALMALFALMNLISLGTISLAAQQKFLAAIASTITLPAKMRDWITWPFISLQQWLCWSLRKAAPLLMLVVATSVVFAHAPDTDNAQLERFWAIQEGTLDKAGAGFMLGIYRPALYETIYEEVPLGEAIEDVESVTAELGSDVSVISIYHWWGDDAIDDFPRQELDTIRNSGAIPMITWQPSLHRFEWAGDFESSSNNQKVMQMIVQGQLDYFIEAYAEQVRIYGGPVMIRFAHEMDNPQYPWSPVSNNTPEEYVAAWRYVVEYFEGMGATNAVWVWNPWRRETMEQYYPGSEYVDWIGLTMLNYGNVEGHSEWTDFASLYASFRDWVVWRQKPVILAEFGSTSLGGSRSAWLVDALSKLSTYPEIEGAVFFDVQNDSSIPIGWNSQSIGNEIDWEMNAGDPALKSAASELLANRPPYRPQPSSPHSPVVGPNRVPKTQEGWQLTHHGRPIRIQGVAYGAGQGWRTVSEPTRRTVERDFAAIDAMGANTVRRYHPHWGDTNIFNAADDNGLSVIPGYWLAVDLDYLDDQDRLDQIEAEVVAMVEDNLHEPSIVMWMLGNETWGLLKHEYEQPRLTEMRHGYLRLIDRLARRIKEIDPTRPVGSAFEASSELAGALSDLDRIAPNIDVVGVNAYYESQLRDLNHLVQVFAGARPWFLSEFGPDGYWDPYDTQWSSQGFPLELSDDAKALQYTDRWQRYVEDLAGYSIGGIAFSWQDRFEGSPTWFGLTDFQGNPKPPYFALARLWNPQSPQELAQPRGLRSSLTPEVTYPGGQLKLQVSASLWPVECDLRVEIYDADTYQLASRHALNCADKAFTLTGPTDEGRYWVSVSAIGANRNVLSASQPLVVNASASTDYR